jgi:hypothetical protein
MTKTSTSSVKTDMKKGAMAEAAERLLAAKGWLPAPLRFTA